MGYHKRKITKGIIGEYSKIQEEYQELDDAHEQDISVLELVECADLIGAIAAYTLKKYNIDIDSLIAMSKATKSAFDDGSRKTNN